MFIFPITRLHAIIVPFIHYLSHVRSHDGTHECDTIESCIIQQVLNP